MGISFSFVPIGGLSGRCALRYLSLSCHSLVFTHFTAFIGTQNLEVFREKESNGLSYFFDSLLVGVLFNFIIYGFGKLGFCCWEIGVGCGVILLWGCSWTGDCNTKPVHLCWSGVLTRWYMWYMYHSPWRQLLNRGKSLWQNPWNCESLKPSLKDKNTFFSLKMESLLVLWDWQQISAADLATRPIKNMKEFWVQRFFCWFCK